VAALRRTHFSRCRRSSSCSGSTKVLTTGMGEATLGLSGQELPSRSRRRDRLHRFRRRDDLAVLGAPLRVWVYWLAVAMVAVSARWPQTRFTSGSASLRRVERVLRPSSLAAIFVAWYRTERTLSIHSINTPRRELFYWATVLATFRARDRRRRHDRLDVPPRLSRLRPAVHRSDRTSSARLPVPRMNPIFTFWFAYVLTRPLGASFADWLDKARYLRGLALGDGVVAVARAGDRGFRRVPRDHAQPDRGRRRAASANDRWQPGKRPILCAPLCAPARLGIAGSY